MQNNESTETLAHINYGLLTQQNAKVVCCFQLGCFSLFFKSPQARTSTNNGGNEAAPEGLLVIVVVTSGDGMNGGWNEWESWK